MLFSSYLFLFYFLPVALAAWFLAPAPARLAVLALFSYGFYGWANPAFAAVMLFSTVVDFACGAVIQARMDARGGAAAPWAARTRAERAALIASVAVNLALLGVFKYFGWGIDSYNALVHALGLEAFRWDAAFRVALPLGISFYTFQSMSYTIDVYRGEARAAARFGDFACYVAMFPQLVAGPIVRFAEIAGQLERPRAGVDLFARGAALFSLGLAKKVLIANVCGQVADACFGAGSLAVLDAWYGLFAYSMQIYFDFGGYTDMALGLGLMLGFRFPRNFDAPYRAASLGDFWRRWHQSLSYFLRDYLYIPLGGSRLGRARMLANLFAVMLIGGLWHGASWSFVAWGAYHGLWLAAERLAAAAGWRLRAPRPLRALAVFLVVSLGWVLFRAADLGAALGYYRALARLGPLEDGRYLVGGLIYQPYYLLTFAAALLLVWAAPQAVDWTRRLTPARALCAWAAFAISAAMLMMQGQRPFLYFTF